MRLASLVIAVAACGTNEGSLLEISAPEGPENVARLEIVLANADKVEDVEGQRVAPRDFVGTESVRYYRQRATAGVIEEVGRANGFVLRLEPNITDVPEKIFVPFLVAYDAQDNVVGVGAVLDENREPTSITIEGGMTRKYFVDMVALAPMDPALGMGERQSMHVVCGVDTHRWTSGIAWRPAGTQLRLLLADRSEDPTATDASERAADLDCDDHAASESDCDDLRAFFHDGRQEACDGMDQNCDGARTAVQSCTTSGCASGGVQLCDDRSGEPIGACVQNTSCTCPNGGCAFCALAFRPTADVAKKSPCAPAVGKMHFPQCTDGNSCTLEVLGTNGPWSAYVSNSQTMGFTTKITGVNAQAFIELKGGDIAGSGGDSVGTLHLVVTQGAVSTLIPVDIQLAEGGQTTQCPVISGTSLNVMTCAP